MTAASAREPWEGRVVEGKYPLLELLGTGKSSSVFRTEFPVGGGFQKAAIQLIPVEPGNVEAQLTRLQLARGLSHPHLIEILDVGQCQIKRAPAIYVVMEYADENLSQVLPLRALTASELAQMLPPMIEALSYLHNKGFVHGRVQPSNIMAVGDTLKLSTDCVRERKLGEPATASQSDNAGFQAPEGANSTPASDIWSLGVVVVAALTQSPPSAFSQLVLAGIPESVPEPFRRIASECLRTDPSNRCTLEQISTLLGSKSPSRLVPTSAPRPSLRRGFTVVGIPILALAAFFGLMRIRGAMRSKPANPAGNSEIAVSTPSPSPSDSQAGSQKGTVPGAVAERVLPNVSAGARRTIQGKIRVTVRVSVSPSGEVSDATLTSPGPSKYFANQAFEASRRWRFRPAEANGQPVSSEWTLKYAFGRSATEVVPSQDR